MQIKPVQVPALEQGTALEPRHTCSSELFLGSFEKSIVARRLRGDARYSPEAEKDPAQITA